MKKTVSCEFCAGVNAVSRSLKLVTSKISQDSNLVVFPAGFTNIDAVSTLTCPGAAANCVIVATQNVQIRSATAGNNWAICTKVDGFFLNNPPCPFLGPPPAGTFAANSFAQSSGALVPGVHSVQTALFCNAVCDRSIYEITYSIYR